MEVRYDREARNIAKRLAESVEDRITIDIDNLSMVEIDRPLYDDGVWVAAWIYIPNSLEEK